MTETQLVKKILDMIKFRRATGEKIEGKKLHGSPMQRAGDPDLLIVHNGIAYLLEVKIGKNKVTKLQAERIRQWIAAGAIAGVVRSVEDVEWLLNAKSTFENSDLRIQMPIRIYIDPGNASKETIQDVLEKLSDLHIAAGGLGLEFSVEEA